MISIAFSGGWDSAITYFWLKHNGYSDDDLYLYNVEYGQPYANAEAIAIKKMKERYNLKIKTYRINLLDESNSPNIENPTIPARNLLMMYLGIFHGDTIAIGSPLGEYAPFREDNTKELDKNPNACEKMSDVLSSLTGRNIKVRSFIESKTKTGWLTWLIENYPDEAKFVLGTTVSCHSNDNYCGKCQPCLWKWCMMISNDIPTEAYWKNGIDFNSYAIKEAITNLKTLQQNIKETDIYYDHVFGRWTELRDAIISGGDLEILR
jgi:7-cyano-7-deazaguanine synthase in queuosine biosynthesis